MVSIHEKEGSIILESDDFDLKIDNNRKIYVKDKGSNIFNYINQDLPRGYISQEKKKYIYNLYLLILKRREEMEQL